MARNAFEIVQALRKTAERIQNSSHYQWGHMGSCNCGFLAQQITHLGKDEIHRRAMDRYGDWNEQLNDYCPTSGLRMDDLISDMLNFGFDTDDLKHLERLSSPEILEAFPIEDRNLSRNVKADVIRYLRKWADVQENKLLSEIDISEVTDRKEAHTDNNL